MSKKIIRRIKQSDPARYYINHEEYTNEIINYKKTLLASDRLGELWKLHVEKCASAGCFKNYTWLDEMKSHALLHLVSYSKSFDPSKQERLGKKPNAFNYCTSMIHNAFIQVINREKKHSDIKDKMVKLQQKIVYIIGNNQQTKEND